MVEAVELRLHRNKCCSRVVTMEIAARLRAVRGSTGIAAFRLNFHSMLLGVYMDIKELLFFDSMITPKLITVLYWLFLAGAIIGGIATMTGASFWMGLLSMLGGVLGARIGCELLMVAFKMNEALQEIRNK